MKKILLICSTFGLLTAMTPQVWAQEKDDAAKKSEDSEKSAGVIVAETNIVKATVQDIDSATRKVTLKDSEGNLHTMKASDEVRNFGQIKKGDEVVAGYYQSVAISVQKPGETPEAPAAAQALIRSPKGEKPGGLAVQTAQKTATVEDIDYTTREVKLKGSDGNTMKIKVGDKVKRLEEVKKGDRIVATYTEALAVSVAKPEE
jgi:Cu/Ag efflux protein CusF